MSEENFPKLSQFMTESLLSKVQESLTNLRNEGYRMHLVNKWEKVHETKVFAYIRYDGLSPFKFQNLPPEAYEVSQVNFFHFPLRLEFQLLKGYIDSVASTAVAKPRDNPFYIKDLPQDSLYLQEMLKKYPVSIYHLDIGFLSQLKFQILDLYSQGKLAEGEPDTEEYEFHLLRFQKLGPSDPKRFFKDPSYKRFFDANFSENYFSWKVADLDGFLGEFPL